MRAAKNPVSAAAVAGLDAAFGVPFVVTTIYLLFAIGIVAAVGRRAQVA